MSRWIALAAVVALAGCGPRPEHKHDGGEPTPEKHGHDHKHGHGRGHDAHAGHGTTALSVHLDRDLTVGEPETLRLTIPAADGKPIKDFAVTHDAKVHLIIVREGLDHFSHLHPDVDAATGAMTAKHTFPAGGKYHLFADYQPAGGKASTAAGELFIRWTSRAAPPLAPDVPGTVTGDGLTAKVSVEPVGKGRESRVRFELLDAAGKPAAGLEPYMGAMGHLNVLSADAKHYVHAHPADDRPAAPNVVSFEVEFPEMGLYKGWGQFKQSGTVRVVPFVYRAP